MQNKQVENKIQRRFVFISNNRLLVSVVAMIIFTALLFVFYYRNHPGKPLQKTQGAQLANDTAKKDSIAYWAPPDISVITNAQQKEQVEYGKELIAHTARYLGPNGTVLHISNGLNCQNCHLQAGTSVFGNNYGSVASLYPKFRARSGGMENIHKRINDCFERSLNGKALDSASKEMQAIVAYIHFIGSNVEKGKKAEGSGLKSLAYLDRAADPEKGKAIYTSKCQSCHQPNGGGVLNADKTAYTFPALWGENSFNDAAGMYYIGVMARYVKYNMPQGATYKKPQLTDEEAWDVAAFVNTQIRPHLPTPKDWPDPSKKPVDHPFGPFPDNFSTTQHKLGPFKPIVEAQKKIQEALQQKTSFTKKIKPAA